MKYRSGVARKINAYVMVLALAAVTWLSALLIIDAYNETLDEIVEETAWRSRDSAQQQLALYTRDEARLEQIATALLQPLPVVYVGIHDYAGEVLLRRFGDGKHPFSPSDLVELRRALGQLDVGRKDSPLASGGFKFIDITVPVFSPVSPSESGLSRQEFALHLASPGAARSQHIIGYYHLGIDREILIGELAPYVRKVALISLLTLLAIFLFTTVMLRIITAPLARLAELAEEIAKGNIDKKIRTSGTGEVRDIASQLSIIINELRKHKAKVDAESSLLALKVEERTEQLSKRNQELTEAVRQVTQTKNQLRQLAYYDSLTQLPNRQLFTEQLNMLLRIAEREGGKIALLFLDLDNFKRINDSLGHNAGDALLREVARRLAGCVRDSDLLAKYVDSETRIGVSRLGGDEFTVVLNNIDEPATAGAIAQRLLETLQAPITIEGHEIVMTPSIGIALAPQDANRVEDLLKLADTAMYHAKASGRNKYSFYTASMKSAGVGRLKLETELRKAIEREELVLHFQPQVCTRTGRILGAEALVRWQHPKHGLIPPVRFIPLAEEMGLIVDIGNWALLEACRQARALQAQQLDLPKMAVNVSSLQFNPNFTQQVQEVLDESGVDPGLMELELTEGVIMSNAKASVEALHSLKELGVSISVDDFGTGYSSLSYLSRFPLDKLKIDRSFVIEYDKSVASTSLVSAIIAMGKSLNLSLVAEGVDTVDQFMFLRAQAVDVIQGYLFSKPLPGDEFSMLLKSRQFPGQIEEIIRESGDSRPVAAQAWPG